MSTCMRFVAIVMAAGSLFFISCKKNATSSDKHFQPKPTPVGNVYGQATTGTIDAMGGAVSTPDGQIQVIIPAGALSGSTVISVQPVETTTPGGIGLSYRLLPHGIQFAKPVTIKFNYAHFLDSISLPDALAIAFQDEDRVWKIPTGYTLNKNNREISVQSRHFSDWSLLSYLYVKPVNGVVYTGQQLELEVLTNAEITDDLKLKDTGVNILAPLGDGLPLDEKHIKEWKLLGEGNLLPNGNTAVYTAPGEVPDRNPVEVTIQLKSSATLLLLTYITILPSKGVWIKLDDKEWLHYDTAKLTKDNGGLALDWATRSDHWQGGIALSDFTWTEVAWSDDNQFWYEEPLRVGTHTVTSFVEVGTRSVPSAGHFKIYKWGVVGSMISGEFKISNAGEYDANGSGAFIQAHTVRGLFNVKRQQ